MEIRTNDSPALISPHPIQSGLIGLVDIGKHPDPRGPDPGIQVGIREQDTAGSANPALTIGHCNHGMERLLDLLHRTKSRS